MKHDLTLPNDTSIRLEGNKITIEGGTQVGKNLFHSFQDFSLSKGDIATFNNALDIANILVRVTGTSASNIDGIISANGIANLFFSNPNGISFGENARLNIGGSFLATTASAFMFPNGSEFSARNPQAPPLLSVNVPVGLRLGSNPGTIQVEGMGDGLIAPSGRTTPIVSNSSIAGLSVQQGKTLALVGGDITLEGANLTAEQGRIELGSVGDSGIVRLNPISQGWALNYEGVSDFKDIHLLKQALINASGNIGGLIALQGRNITIEQGATVLNQNSGSEPWGGIEVNASDSFKMLGVSSNGKFVSLLRTESIGSGNGGDVNISAQNVVLEGGSQFGTRTYNAANGGNISVSAFNSIKMLGFSPSNPSFASGIYSTSTSNTHGKAGDITVSTKQVDAQNGGLITSSALGNGDGGNVTINSTDFIQLINSVELINSGKNYIPSYLASETYTQGNAGNLTINTLKLVVGEKSFAHTSTVGYGSAGILTISAADVEITGSISASATRAIEAAQKLFGAPPTPSGSPGEVKINTTNLSVKNGGQVSVANEGTSNAGLLEIDANSINLDNKASITASTASGKGGNISLEARNVQLRHNSFITATAQSGQGNGGNINIKSGTVALLEDSGITANAFEGKGGNISVYTQGFFVSPDSRITASSAKGVNGIVTINTAQIDFGNAVLTKTAFNPPGSSKLCASSSESEDEFINAGSGGIPESPSDTFNSLDGWSDERKPDTTNSSETIATASQTQAVSEYKEAQGWRNNTDGTISFTDIPSEATPRSSLSAAPCHSDEESQTQAQQSSGESNNPPQQSTQQ